MSSRLVARLALVILGAMAAAWLLFSWFEADREIEVLCSMFQPGLDREEVVRTLETGEYLTYRVEGGGGATITVDSLYNLRSSRCVVEHEAGRVVSARYESGTRRRASEARDPTPTASDHHWAVVFYLPPGLDGIEKLRRRHDPTAELIRSHVAVVFPLPGHISRGDLETHIEGALAGVDPFQILLGGSERSPDHWLLVTLATGRERFQELYSLLHTGLLAEFRRDYVPHVGLGHFLREGVTYDWETPRESDLDQVRYSAALEEAEALDLGGPMVVDELHLIAIPDEVIDWASGRRPDLPAGTRVREVRVFRLGGD